MALDENVSVPPARNQRSHLAQGNFSLRLDDRFVEVKQDIGSHFHADLGGRFLDLQASTFPPMFSNMPVTSRTLYCRSSTLKFGEATGPDSCARQTIGNNIAAIVWRMMDLLPIDLLEAVGRRRN